MKKFAIIRRIRFRLFAKGLLKPVCLCRKSWHATLTLILPDAGASSSFETALFASS
jgi:hypothetical protein